MQKDLISVILPVYNVEKYLDKCLNSLINQTYQNLEIILVDDGSPDNSGKICDDWTTKDSRIKVIHKENGGVSSARNLGLDTATGNYITFLDPDDYVDLQMYEKMLSAIHAQNADMAMCGMTNVYELNGLEEIVVEENLPNININSQTYLLLNNKFRKNGVLYTDTIMGSVCRCLFNKSLISTTRFEKVMICEDLVFVSDIFKKNPLIAVVNEHLYYYLQRPTSALHSINLKKIESRLEAIELLYNRLNESVDKSVMGALLFAEYSGCTSKLIANYSIKEVKKFINNNQFINSTMNTKFNYKMQLKNVGFIKKFWLFFIYKKWFGITKIFVKLVMNHRKNKTNN